MFEVSEKTEILGETLFVEHQPYRWFISQVDEIGPRADLPPDGSASPSPSTPGPVAKLLCLALKIKPIYDI